MTPEVTQEKKADRNRFAAWRPVFVAVAFFVLGAGASGYWFSARAKAISQRAKENPSAARGEAVGDSAVAGQGGAAAPQMNEQDLEDMAAAKRSVAKFETSSLENGTRTLRDAALAEFKQAVDGLQQRQKKIQQDFLAAQANHSEEKQAAATRQLQELQAEQMETLKQISAKAKLEIDAFQDLKKAVR